MTYNYRYKEISYGKRTGAERSSNVLLTSFDLRCYVDCRGWKKAERADHGSPNSLENDIPLERQWTTNHWKHWPETQSALSIMIENSMTMSNIWWLLDLQI